MVSQSWHCFFIQLGDVQYNLHKNKRLNPFGSVVWELSDGARESPGTIIIRKAPFKRHTSFERRDGSLLASMCNRLIMTGSDFSWEGKVYRSVVLCACDITLTILACMCYTFAAIIIIIALLACTNL